MEDTEVKHRPSAVERMAKATRPRYEPEVEEAMDTYEEARARSREAFMLELRFKDGKVRNFDYGHLRESEFMPQDKMVFRFAGKEVTAEGKNLRGIYTSITEHRRRFIQEGSAEEEASKPENAAHIDRIEVRIAAEE
jgi:hypothetical protein